MKTKTSSDLLIGHIEIFQKITFLELNSPLKLFLISMFL